MFDIVEKNWPMSDGDGKATQQERPRILAITTDCCTGCAGSPACIEYCPIEACMFWVCPDGQIIRPSAASKSIHTSASDVRSAPARARMAPFLDGCPWDAIEMIPTDDWEAMHDITLPDLPPAPTALVRLNTVHRS